MGKLSVCVRLSRRDNNRGGQPCTGRGTHAEYGVVALTQESLRAPARQSWTTSAFPSGSLLTLAQISHLIKSSDDFRILNARAFPVGAYRQPELIC